MSFLKVKHLLDALDCSRAVRTRRPRVEQGGTFRLYDLDSQCPVLLLRPRGRLPREFHDPLGAHDALRAHSLNHLRVESITVGLGNCRIFQQKESSRVDLFDEVGEFLAIHRRIIARYAQFSNHQRESSALHEESDDCNGERDQQQLRTIGRGGRQRMDGRDGDNPAHPGPRNHDATAPAEPFGVPECHIGAPPRGPDVCLSPHPFVCQQSAPAPTCQVAARQSLRPALVSSQQGDERNDEGDPDDGQDDRGEKSQFHRLGHAEMVVLDLVDKALELETHHQEYAVLQDELGGAPVDSLADSSVRRKVSCTLVARHEARHDDGEHPGRIDLVRGDEGKKGHCEGNRRVEHGVVEARPHPHGRVPDEEADDDRRDNGVGEISDHPAESDDSCRRGQSRTQEHESGRVVDEAFAVQHADEPRRKTDPPPDRGRGDGIRWADHGTEGDCHRKAQLGQQPVEDRAHDKRAGEHENDRETGDRLHVATKVDDGDIDGCRVENRRKDTGENERRGDYDGGGARNQACRESDHNQNQRSHHAKLWRNNRNDNHDQDSEDDHERIGHPITLCATTRNTHRLQKDGVSFPERGRKVSLGFFRDDLAAGMDWTTIRAPTLVVALGSKHGSRRGSRDRGSLRGPDNEVLPESARADPPLRKVLPRWHGPSFSWHEHRGCDPIKLVPYRRHERRSRGGRGCR